MAITYPLTPPTDPDARKVTVMTMNAVAVTESPFSFAQQVQEWSGQRWALTVELPPMQKASANAWIAFLQSLRGRLGTFLYCPPTNRTPRGSIPGAPVVNGAGQTGQDLATDGWTATQTGILLAGDLIQLGTGSGAHLHMVLEDADSDGAGASTLTLWPNLRESPGDGSAVVVSNPVGLFRLVSGGAPWSVDEAHVYGLSFGAEEAL